jgi:hypothetical protein
VIEYTKGEWRVLNSSTPTHWVVIMQPDGVTILVAKDLPLDDACLVARAPLMYEALREIAQGKGAYSMDRMTHAENTIRDMTGLAQGALDGIESLREEFASKGGGQ